MQMYHVFTFLKLLSILICYILCKTCRVHSCTHDICTVVKLLCMYLEDLGSHVIPSELAKLMNGMESIEVYGFDTHGERRSLVNKRNGSPYFRLLDLYEHGMIAISFTCHV